MASISDLMLVSGCATHVDAFHGEQIKILSGPDAGKFFTAVKETEMDLTISTEISNDRRAKRVIRFLDSSVPNIESQDEVQTSDGRKWTVVNDPGDGYLSTDFEIREIDPKHDS